MSNSHDYDVVEAMDLSAHGLFFALPVVVIIPILLVLALIYDQAELAIFTLILGSVAVLTRIWGHSAGKRIVRGVSLDREKAFPGEMVNLTVSVKNNKLLPILIKVRLAVNPDLTDDAESSLIIEDRGMLWFEPVAIHRQVLLKKRGVYSTGSPKLITADFLGFFPKMSSFDEQAEILVYPNLRTVPRFHILRRIMFGKQSLASPIYDPVYLLGTRDYQSHSPGKNIHWKASARFNQLREKVFEPTEREKVLIGFEVDGFIEAGDRDQFELAIEVIAALGVELESTNHGVGFITNGGMFQTDKNQLFPARRKNQISEFLEMLARLEFRVGSSENEITASRSLFSPGVSCLYLSYNPLPADHPVIQLPSPVVNIVVNPTREGAFKSGEGYFLNTIFVDDLLADNSHDET